MSVVLTCRVSEETAAEFKVQCAEMDLSQNQFLKMLVLFAQGVELPPMLPVGVEELAPNASFKEWLRGK